MKIIDIKRIENFWKSSSSIHFNSILCQVLMIIKEAPLRGRKWRMDKWKKNSLLCLKFNKMPGKKSRKSVWTPHFYSKEIHLKWIVWKNKRLFCFVFDFDFRKRILWLIIISMHWGCRVEGSQPLFNWL